MYGNGLKYSMQQAVTEVVPRKRLFQKIVFFKSSQVVK